MAYFQGTDSGAISLPEVVEQPCGLYPEPESFSGDYGDDDYCEWVDQSNGDPLPAPLVMYVQQGAQDTALSSGLSGSSGNLPDAAERELSLQGALFDADRPLQQLICSGPVASQWTDDELHRLVSVIRSSFSVRQDDSSSWCACLSDICPSVQRLQLLRILGFNHIRYAPGARIGPEISELIQHARQLGFEKTIVDLRQVPGDAGAHAQVLTTVLSGAQPDRVRLFASDVENRKQFDAQMTASGYRNIGLDWYLRESDRWWRAVAHGELYWTLLGYSELKNPDVIGIGPGAVSAVCDFYGTNALSPVYERRLEEGRLPVVRGIELEDSEVLRREIMSMILASFCIRVADIENKWGIEFERYFACESEMLRAFERNGWVRRRDGRVEIVPRTCRELVEICRVFDGRATNPLTRTYHAAPARPARPPRSWPVS
jgi:oxygen-independent coproporphyrinogen-3 oxidase